MNEIKTGYTPEFGLGAFFQGVNSANADAFNEEELLKQRLANQQSQVMNPLEAQLKQLSVAPAQYEAALSKARLTDPDYIRSMLNERKGQAALAEVTGRKAKALEPFAIKAEQSKLENEFEDTDLLRRFRTGQDDLLAGGGTDPTTGQVVPYTPAQRQAAQNYNQGLLGILKNTPKFAQDKELFDDKQEAAMQALEARLNAQHEADLLRAQSKESQKQMKYNEILMRAMQDVANPAISPEQKAISQKILDLHRMNILYSNPAAWSEGIDISKLGDIPMKPSIVERAGGESPAVKLPPGVKLLTK